MNDWLCTTNTQSVYPEPLLPGGVNTRVPVFGRVAPIWIVAAVTGLSHMAFEVPPIRVMSTVNVPVCAGGTYATISVPSGVAAAAM